MTVKKERNDTELTIYLDGRLDTITAPGFEEQLEPALDGVTKLILDFEKLEYISSAGLRVLVTAIQIMEEQGEMILRNVCTDVMDVFEVTGFIDELTIE